MDSLTETQTPVYLYEALTPLFFSNSDQSPPSGRSPPPVVESEPESYSVFRNEIYLTASEPASMDSAAPAYFSLDIAAGADGPDRIDEGEPATPVASTKKGKKKNKKDNETEPRLENSWFTGNSMFKSPMLQLHKEIVDFCDFLSPTPEEQASRNAAVECVFDIIKYIWPSCEVEVFGSYRTGLYLPTSDIDVVILKSGIKIPQMGLQALSRALSQRGMAKKMQVIAKARVPLVKFVEKKSGVSFDISFDMENGPKAAEFIQGAVSKWPPLRSLCLILKVFLQQRELNEVYTGGIGSYALLAMLIAMLKNLHEGRTSPEHNLGILLVNFFDFYGRKLNTADVGVSCKAGGTFFLKSSKGFSIKGRPSLISIEDPQAPENDIGKNSFNYFQIRSAFAMAFTTLTNPKTILALGPNKSILGTIIRPDPVLLERKGGLNGDVTFNTLLPGAGEPLQRNNEVQNGLLCNWQLDDEEPLPRGDSINGDVIGHHSSGKKRKASSRDKSGKKKLKENEETESRKEMSVKKRRHRRLKHQGLMGYGESPSTY